MGCDHAYKAKQVRFACVDQACFTFVVQGLKHHLFESNAHPQLSKQEKTNILNSKFAKASPAKQADDDDEAAEAEEEEAADDDE